MRTLLIIILSNLFIYSFCSSQTILQGTITDIDRPVIGAAVYIYQGQKEKNAVVSDFDGNYIFTAIDTGTYDLKVVSLGYAQHMTTGIKILENTTQKVDVTLSLSSALLDEVVITNYRVPLVDFDQSSSVRTVTAEAISRSPLKNDSALKATSAGLTPDSEQNISIRGTRSNATNYYVDGIRVTEKKFRGRKKRFKRFVEETHPEQNNYSQIVENSFMNAVTNPLSTLSIDVDRASYSNVRRLIRQGSLPPANAVRVEEMINYFDYDFEKDVQIKDRPFQTNTSLTECPWNSNHKMLHVVLQGDKIEREEVPSSNLTFLIDVSGSMDNPDKLPLLKSAFKLLINQLREEDRIALVVYAGAAGLVLPSTTGENKVAILEAIDNLSSGGSTAGGAGIQLAYQVAKENFIPRGNNRVILATDGDFNVGTSDDDQLIELIKTYRNDDVFLSILGFGTGNYQDGKMQKIADAGNGNHSYIDDLQEAKKVFQDEFTGTLFTIAKDVKIQIEFNPNLVESYRMVGYENRVLNVEDFNDDSKDAGEMGAGHQVTIIYEIISPDSKSSFTKKIDPLKYQANEVIQAVNSTELATIKYRYKEPTAARSIKSVEIIRNDVVAFSESSAAAQWSASVAEFGMLLRKSPFLQDTNYRVLIERMEMLLEGENDLYKNECLELVKLAQQLSIKHVAAK